MEDKSSSTTWWQTLPGILTAVAALLTAVGGLILAFHQAGLFDRTSQKAPAVQNEAVKSSTMTGDRSWDMKRTLVPGTDCRTRRATSMPLRLGSPISRTIKSGMRSPAVHTASSPSPASPTIWKFGRSSRLEQTTRRHGSKSSTTRIRTIEFSKCLPLNSSKPGPMHPD